MDSPSVPTKVKNKTRQKRILPSRSRRGGPGVGNCDADLLILDTQKRKLEHEPLIPIDTPFLLTTNNALVAESSNATKLGINAHANHRYFDRPEVLKAYREQQIIQTPEFINVADIPSVGGRFRPRGFEDEAADTSDAAYEKRHRKYESFERRQRLREKEKLKYEQYKLKERIEQLRAMDGGAFLPLPASSFSPAPPKTDEEQDNDDDGDEEDAITAAAYREGERRRSEMLDIAMGLEERYRVLLPPERIKQAASSYSYTKSETSSHKETHQTPDISDMDLRSGREKKEVEKIKLKIKFPARANHAAAQVSPSGSTTSTRRKASLSTAAPVTTRRTRTSHAPSISEPRPYVLSFTPPNPSQPAISEQENTSPIETPCSQSKLQYSPPDSGTDDGSTSREGSAQVSEADWDETSQTDEMLDMTTSSPPQKRPRVSYSPTLQSTRGSSPFVISASAPGARRSTSRPTAVHASPAQYVTHSGAGKAERPSSLLLVAAIRRSGSRARKTGRHVGAFGTKLPIELEQPQDYELPAWILQGHLDLDRGADERTVSPTNVSPEHTIENNSGTILSESKTEPND